MMPRLSRKKKKSSPKPLFRCLVHCPMCNEASHQYRVNHRVFWNKDIDIDLQPRDYMKLDHVDPSFHPPLHYMWYCPACHFTAGYRHFIHPLKDVYVRVEVVAERIREAYQHNADFRAIVKRLTRDLDTEHMDFFQGLRLHLLAIVELELIEDMVKQYFLNLGRYCLHLAWLYRDLERLPEVEHDTRPRLQELYQALEPHWPDIPRTEVEALDKAARYYDQTFERSPEVKTVIDEVSILQVIARIYIKLDRCDEARGLINQSVARASKAREKIEAKLHDLTSSEGKALTPEQSGELVTQSRRLRTEIDEAKRLLQYLTETRLAEHKRQALDLIEQNKDKPRGALRTLLRERHIDRRIIREVLPPAPPSKKGILPWS